MKFRLKHLSSRFHLALGLSSLVVSVLLMAQFAGLVPDRDGAVRSARVTLAETVSVSSMAMLGEEDRGRLQQVLDFVVQRNPGLRAVTLRRADGVLHLQAGTPVADPTADAATDAAHSTDTHLRLQLMQGAAAWGMAELQFDPLPGLADWRAWRGSTELLVGATALCCFGLFYFYLRRMLRHLDPSKVIPGRVRAAYDTLAEGLVIVDRAGRIMLANRTFSEVVGKEPDDLFQIPVADLAWLQPSLPAHADTPWHEVLTDGQSRRNVLMHLTDAGGRARTFMVNVSPVTSGSGPAAGTLISLDDVTTLEEKEVQLRLARDEAEAANRAKSDFLANMSHEIRTPMNAILGFAELLRRGWQNNPQDTRRHLDTILGSGRHLLALINDILDLSKVEAGRMEVERVPCAAHQVVHEVADIMRLRAEEKGVQLVVAFPEDLPAEVLTDPARLRQIITNLIGNALKFTLQGGVTVTLRMVQGADDGVPRLGIDIADTGIGIPADKLDAIFEPFVQAEASTTRQFGGTGLGLAISRRFARALGGDVTVSSTPGQGSTFHVTLDTGALDGVAWLAPAALAATQRVPAAEGEVHWHFESGRVLVVDDGAENRELVRLVLESVGLTVLEAHDGAMALDVVAREAPDLVLMDVNMPVMDGYTATRTLRERGCTLPVLALTANAMKGFEREIESAGFTGYLTKPVDIDMLLAELAVRLDGRQVAVTLPMAAAAPASESEWVEVTPALADEPIVSRLANHPRLARVVRTFGRTLPVKLTAMQSALDDGRIDDLADLAHWLKGAGGTVGFDVFFEPAREFERLARAGERAGLERSLRQIQALASRIVVPDGEATVAATLA